MFRRVTLCAVLVAAVFGACNDDNPEPDTGAPTTSTSSPGGGSVVEAGRSEVKASDFAFDPKSLTVKAGTPVAVRVTNTGNAPHTFTVDGLSVDQQIAPGQQAQVLLRATSAGPQPFYCRFHRGQGMEGTLQVE